MTPSTFVGQVKHPTMSASQDQHVNKKPRKSRFDQGKRQVNAILTRHSQLGEQTGLLATGKTTDYLNNLNSALAAAKRKRKLKTIIPELRLNDKGQQIDEQGNVIQMKRRAVASVRANRREAIRAANPYLRPVSQDSGAKKKVKPKKPLRVSRAFKFVEPGKLSKQADKQRARILRKEIFGAPKLSFNSMHNSDKYGSVDANSTETGKRIINGVVLPERPEEKNDTPDVEWWDLFYITKAEREAAKNRPVADGPGLSYDLCSIENCKTVLYVEHPVPVEPIIKPSEGTTLELMLTKRERKRIRRQTRANREKEKQEAIQVGLMKAPEPKLNISNMMRAMGTEAIMDPTALEARVRKQVAQRIRNHEQRNLAQKLTPAERRQKKKKKKYVSCDVLCHTHR